MVKNKSIIVTGATSFIGAEIVKTLIKNNAKVFAVVRPNSSKLSKLENLENCEIIECDISNFKSINLPKLNEYEALIHCAWNGTRVPERDDLNIQQQNFIDLQNTFEKGVELKVKKFIGIGSQAEYGLVNSDITEDTDCNPNTPYGLNKLNSYKYIIDRAKELKSIQAIWVRVFSIFGIGDYDKTLISTAIQSMRMDAPLQLSHCTQNWNYTYVKDLARMFLELINYKGDQRLFNLTCSDNRPLKDYVLELKNLLHSNSELSFGSIPARSEGIVSFKPSNKLFLKEFPDFTFTPFNEAIDQMISEQLN